MEHKKVNMNREGYELLISFHLVKDYENNTKNPLSSFSHVFKLLTIHRLVSRVIFQLLPYRRPRLKKWVLESATNDGGNYNHHNVEKPFKICEKRQN